MNLKENEKAYLEARDECEEKRDKIQERINAKREKINRLENQIDKLTSKYWKTEVPSWIDYLVVPLAEKLAEHFECEYEILGPFGLGARTSIWLKPTADSDIEDIISSITLIPLLRSEGQPLLEYETGESKESNVFPKGSIGEMNGFNKVVEPLPQDLNAVIKIMEKRKRE